MSFIGPRLFMQIDSWLREAFSEKKYVPFGGRSIILVGDLGQLPPVRDKPLYVGNTTGKLLWKDFKKFVTLDTIFRQRGTDPKQSIFRIILTNIKNTVTDVDNWHVLMSQIDSSMDYVEHNTFNLEIHLFPTNTFVNIHNRCMLKSLNTPIS